MTGETHIVATPPVAATPSRDPGSKAAAPPPTGGDAKPAGPAPAATQTPPAPSFPVTLQFDQETHRFFIEARDQSGLVVLQIPFKPAVPLAASTTSGSTRGQRVNSKA